MSIHHGHCEEHAQRGIRILSRPRVAGYHSHAHIINWSSIDATEREGQTQCEHAHDTCVMHTLVHLLVCKLPKSL